MQFNWEGRGNLSAFVELAGKSNLFVNLRIGPYVVSQHGGRAVTSAITLFVCRAGLAVCVASVALGL